MGEKLQPKTETIRTEKIEMLYIWIMGVKPPCIRKIKQMLMWMDLKAYELYLINVVS